MEDISALKRCTRTELADIANQLGLPVSGRKSDLEARIWEHYQEPDNQANADTIINRILLASPGHGRRARQIIRTDSQATETGDDNLTTPAKSELGKDLSAAQRSPQNTRRTKVLPVSRLESDTNTVTEGEALVEAGETVAEQTPTRRRSFLPQQLIDPLRSSPKTERVLLKLRQQYSSVSAVIQALIVCEFIALIYTTIRWEMKSTGPVTFYLSGTTHEFYGPVPSFALFTRFDTFWYGFFGWLLGFIVIPALPALVVHIGQALDKSGHGRRASRRISDIISNEKPSLVLFQCGDYGVNVITWCAARLALIYVLRGISPSVAEWPPAVYAHISQELLVVTGAAGLLFTVIELLSK
ncbi:hypothetical protein BDF22DRAFT_97620 [Syncephalis plumigaleata]|nr:hypothetical protein BDF22DRAFT_97620 [Syncephalis plumigaleata]